MKLRTIGRGIALASVAVDRVRRMLELRCDRPRPHRAAASAAAAGRRRADHDRLPAEGHRQPVLRRGQDRHRQGGRRDRRDTVIQVGPNEAKADLQIPFITDLTTQKVNAIIISADGKDEVAPALKAAMAAGHQGRRLRLEPGRRRLRRLRQPGRLQRRRREPRRLGVRARPELHRRHRDPLGGRHGDQPERVDRAHEDDPATDAKYKGLKLVDTVYGDDKPRSSTTQAQGLLTKYPNLKVIVAPTTVGILAAAQVVSAGQASRTRSR